MDIIENEKKRLDLVNLLPLCKKNPDDRLARKNEFRTTFGRTAGKPETHFIEFSRYLRNVFGVDTETQVLDAFQKMGIPAPVGGTEYLEGTEGALVFLNRHGIVIRIIYKEAKKNLKGEPLFDRINDSPWITTPLASIPVGNAIIEICPAVPPATKDKQNSLVYKELEKQGIRFWDSGLHNMGLIPVITDNFPEGIPHVVDREAVRKITESVTPIETALAREAAEAKEKFYAPLRESFNKAWPDPQKMRQFWALCHDYVRDGKLVAGWNVAEPRDVKTRVAPKRAIAYETRLQSATQPACSAAVAVRQSPCPLV